MNNEKPFRILLTVGDWSDDGHGQTDDFLALSSHKLSDVQDAYRKGVSILGFDVQEFCEDYEDSYIPAEFSKKLRKLKCFDWEPDKWNIDNLDGESIGSETYVEIILFTVKLGNPEIKIEIPSEPDNENWFVGGYGLFS